MNIAVSMAYILRYTEESQLRHYSLLNEINRLIWLVGNTNEVRWFYSAMSRSKKILRNEMLQVPLTQLQITTVKKIVYIIGTTTTEDSLHLPNFEDFRYEPANVITVILENTQVPIFLKETKQINVTGNEDKWLSDVLKEIKSKGKFLKVVLN